MGTDICKKPECNPSTGCLEVDKTAAEIAALCNDNNQCTIDTCANNACVYTPSVTCPNNTACAQYTCNPATGACDETLTVCNDNDLCTTDTCNPLTGCVYTAVTCNDTSRCTMDTCNPAIGCIYSQIICDDNMTT